ncbi:hypothetical protein BUE93_08675 [Chromobacterium amazonense]|uniref:Nucleotide exchange factor GrpE n=1 Tax=Chromobacterium amazonense TaxID=1382803 RepID=A0A2S9X5M1_9NEIS|nr:hypothetical protein [Chromobacterium amazonense]PRP71020.1 hypothetical protein BUE93_08675 [Chromobacterium amazonense]
MNHITAILFITRPQEGEGSQPEHQQDAQAVRSEGAQRADKSHEPAEADPANQLDALRQQVEQLQQEVAAYKDALERTEAQMESTDKENDALREALNLMRLPMDLRNYAIDLARGAA